MLALVEHAALFEPVSEGSHASAEASLLNHLAERRFGSDGGLFAFTVRLPESDVVGQEVRVRIKSLFSLVDAPHSYPRLNEFLDHEGRFRRYAADAVEHEHQQDVKLPFAGVFFYELYLIAVSGMNLKAGDAVFLFLSDDCPALPIGELVTRLALHGDVRFVVLVVIHLLCRGYAV
jgi:hypothetical protein